MSKILNIVETAYRGTIEEQDDTTLWLTHILKNSGGDVSVLLRSNAVNYAVKGQEASGLVFGEEPTKNWPRIERDLTRMLEAGIPVYWVTEDAERLGLSEKDFITGLKPISQKKLPELFDHFDKVWHW